MKFVQLHKKNTTIVYKNALCSSATVFVLVFIVLSVMVPVLLVSLLSPYSGISESRLLYEQPFVKFKHQFIFFGIIENKSINLDLKCNEQTLVVCSTTSYLNALLMQFSRFCAGHKYWTKDANHNGRIDHVYFKLKLDAFPGKLKYFDLVLFYEAELKHKCILKPPALLAQRITFPENMHKGRLVLIAELQLKQYTEFMCPFQGSNIKTHFRDVSFPIMGVNMNRSATIPDLPEFQIENLLKQLRINSAYFQIEIQESYIHANDAAQQIEIELQLHVPQVPARYHLNIWERLGQFWLYFASFFGISFYIMNKLKDFLFGRHIIRAWEVIPWKKIY